MDFFPPTPVLIFAAIAAFYTVVCLLNTFAVKRRERIELYKLRSDVIVLRRAYALRIKRLREARMGSADDADDPEADQAWGDTMPMAHVIDEASARSAA